MSDNAANLSDSEKKIFSCIEGNDPVLLKTALLECPNVNIVDDNMMTPLQLAAYKGNKEILQMLLDQGADPNLCQHENNYTALHFAALNGNDEVCMALLQAGAKSGVTNSVNRTAAQMAAFVSHHNCAATINNFVPKSAVDYYTVTRGTETQPPLPPFISESFHKLILQNNIHPVKVALNVQNFVGISDHLAKVREVLELMSRREMKKGAENNEVMSFKYHYLSYIVGELLTIRQRQVAVSEEKSLDVTELFTRKILKPNRDGTLEFLDNVLKECIREFPFRECTLFRQMVSTLAVQDPPTALSVVTSAINGQRGFIDNIPVCQTCSEEKPTKKCSKCRAVRYCDRNCQRLHWHWHKKVCGKMSQGAGDLEAKPAPDPNELAAEVQNLLVQ